MEPAVVQAFNNLPRPQTTPTNLPNHWYFTIRHVDLNPPGDLVHLVNPQSHYIHCAGPTQILPLPSPTAKANTIVPLLLDSFIQGINTGPDKEPLPDMPAFAPWSWGTKDPELAKAIEKKLKEVGVKKELCTVQLGTKEQEDVSDETWTGFMQTLKERVLVDENQERDVTTCATCKKGSSALSGPLKKCSRCEGPRYCSQECQKADWKQHKKVCGKPPGESGSNMLDPFNYYNKVAQGVPGAQDLARSLNLNLPRGSNATEGLLKPIRRLVITGLDTPDNLRVLLGPNWQKTQASTHEQARIDILLHPPPGSPSYALHSRLDEGSPAWSPRPANDAERETVENVREMQAAISRHLGSRTEPTAQDMQAILTTFGPTWPTMVPTYQLAINAMDQGVGTGLPAF